MKTVLLPTTVFLLILCTAGYLDISNVTAQGGPAGQDTVKHIRLDNMDANLIQLPERHQRYKNTEITGDRKSLAKKLDLTESGGKTGVHEYAYTGTFAGYPVRNTLFVTPITETVYSVVAYLDRRSKFDQAYEDYNVFKTNLTEVYGPPATQKEEFASPYKRGDGYSIRALKEGKATFLSAWDTGLGVVFIKIIPSAETSACLMISYTDTSGQELYDAENKEIIKRDL